MNMEHCWNDAGRRKPERSVKYQSQCHLVHHKSHTYWHGIETWLPHAHAAWGMARPSINL